MATKTNRDIVIQIVIATAKAEKGIKEDPPFSNKIKYNKWYYKGSNIPAYWCATFLSWVITKATGGYPVRFENCPFWMNYHKQYKTFIPKTGKAEIGDIVFLAFSDSDLKAGIPSHVGLVTQVFPDGSVMTIEGNTSKSEKGSQSNGGEVAEKRRYQANIVGFGRHNFTRMYDYQRKGK